MKKTLAAAALVCAPLAAHAGAVDLAAEGYSATGTVYSFNQFDWFVSGGAFSAFDTLSTSAIDSGTATDVSSYNMSLSDGDLFSPSSISAIGGINSNFGPVPLEMIFTNVIANGVFAAANGEAVLLSLNDSSLSFAEGDIGQASVSVTVLSEIAPIPLPAGALLLLSAGGVVVALRRRSKG